MAPVRVTLRTACVPPMLLLTAVLVPADGPLLPYQMDQARVMAETAMHINLHVSY